MRDSGFVGPAIPGEKLLYTLFNAIGETLPSMALARQAATFARGRPRAAMRQAGEAAAGTLAAMVQPFAWPLINEHREAGRKLVIATTTPYDLVKPLADWLGFDDLVATRYGVNADGTFDGTIVGPFVWAGGKLAAVRRWAADNASTSPRASRTPTACSTRRCCRRSATRSSSTPTRAWSSWRRCADGRYATSTCRPAC